MPSGPHWASKTPTPTRSGSSQDEIYSDRPAHLFCSSAGLTRIINSPCLFYIFLSF